MTKENEKFPRKTTVYLDSLGNYFETEEQASESETKLQFREYLAAAYNSSEFSDAGWPEFIGHADDDLDPIVDWIDEHSDAIKKYLNLE